MCNMHKTEQNMQYEEFVAAKAITTPSTGFEPRAVSELTIFDFLDCKAGA